MIHFTRFDISKLTGALCSVLSVNTLNERQFSSPIAESLECRCWWICSYETKRKSLSLSRCAVHFRHSRCSCLWNRLLALDWNLDPDSKWHPVPMNWDFYWIPIHWKEIQNFIDLPVEETKQFFCFRVKQTLEEATDSVHCQHSIHFQCLTLRWIEYGSRRFWNSSVNEVNWKQKKNFRKNNPATQKHSPKPSTFTQQRYVAIPSRLQSHFFRKNTGPQFIFLAEMNETDTSPVQSFNQLNNVRLSLILHRHHSDEHLMALHFKATSYVIDVFFLIFGKEQRIRADWMMQGTMTIEIGMLVSGYVIFGLGRKFEVSHIRVGWGWNKEKSFFFFSVKGEDFSIYPRPMLLWCHVSRGDMKKRCNRLSKRSVGRNPSKENENGLELSLCSTTDNKPVLVYVLVRWVDANLNHPRNHHNNLGLCQRYLESSAVRTGCETRALQPINNGEMAL